MQVRHPHNDDAVHVNGDMVATDGDGVFDAPERWVERWCDANGFDVSDVMVDDADTCEVVKTDGEVCGRDKPCPYHSEDDDAE